MRAWWSPSRQVVAAGVVLAVCSWALAGAVTGAGAAVTRVEMESLATPANCWTVASQTAASNGTFRQCSVTGQALSWTVVVPTAQTAIVTVGASLNANVAQARVRYNAGAWTLTSPTATATSTVQQTVYTSAVLAPGSYAFDLEYVSGAIFRADYYDVTSTPDATTTVAPSTTVAPATTTTTLDQRFGGAEGLPPMVYASTGAFAAAWLFGLAIMSVRRRGRE